MAKIKKEQAKPEKKLEPVIGPEPEHWEDMTQIEIVDEIIAMILQIPPPCR